MNKFRTLIIWFAAVGVPLTIQAQTLTNDQPLVGQIIETLALSNKITQLPANFEKQFEQNPFRLSEQTSQNWLNAFKKAYDRELLMQDYREIFQVKLSELSVEELQAWLNKPSTQQLAEARHEHYSLQGKRMQIVALYELDKDPLSNERQQLLGKYAEAITPKEAVIEAAIAVFKSIVNSVDQVSTKLNFTEAQTGMIINNFRQQEPEHIKQLAEKGLPVKFYNVPSETISQSLNFWQSKTGQTLAKAIYTSLQQTYKKAGQRLLKAVNQ